MNRSPFQRILPRQDLNFADKLVFYFLYYRKMGDYSQTPRGSVNAVKGVTQLEILNAIGAGSISTIKRALDRLEELKMITVHQNKGGRINEYTVNDMK